MFRKWRLGGGIAPRDVFRQLMSQADSARDRGSFIAAGTLYEAALRYRPDNAAAHMQAGHMFKEARDFVSAGVHYDRVAQVHPKDPETHIQLGHYYKTMARYEAAERHYREAALLAPDNADARDEIERIPALIADRNSWQTEGSTTGVSDDGLEIVGGGRYLDRSLFPQPRDELLIDHRPAIVFTRLGAHRRTRYGDGLTVAGVDSLRGYFVSDVPLLKVEIYLDGELIFTDRLITAPQRYEKSNPNLKKYVYNAWIDFTDKPRGRREFVFRGVSVGGEAQEGRTWRREQIIVDDPVPAELWPDSDNIIPALDDQPGETLEQRINALPTVVHKASSNSFPVVLKNILVMRIDQLGDLAVSVPALRRLREIAPDAHITALLSPSNEGLGRTLGLFDEILTVNVPDDEFHRRRVLGRDGQEALAAMLSHRKYDVVMDLAVAGVSHRLMPLAGAPIMMGFGGSGWYTLGLNMATHDPKSYNDVMRHSGRTRILVESLGAWLNSGATAVTRPDLERASLEAYGIAPGERFIVLHTGARIKFTRWQGFTALAERLIAESDLKIVVMSDEAMPQDLAALVAVHPDRMVATVGKMPFDMFDALLSFCSVFVGNDSGPKHLAALRGSKVVSIHSSRINWNEWGQEIGGVILSRKVPCAGCSLHNDPEECGKDVACVRLITVDEVLREVRALLDAD